MQLDDDNVRGVLNFEVVCFRGSIRRNCAALCAAECTVARRNDGGQSGWRWCGADAVCVDAYVCCMQGRHACGRCESVLEASSSMHADAAESYALCLSLIHI